MGKKPNVKGPPSADRLGSKDLAALIVDALLRANIVKEADVPQAVKLTVEEIEVRRSLGDY